MDCKAHWEAVYRKNGPDQVSWFQPEARLSRSLIEHVASDRDATILDVGAGASTLVDGLLASGYRHVTVMDLSAAALTQARQRLGPAAAADVTWLEADVLTARLPAAGFDVWHDRAVFHFLTLTTDRRQYIAQVRHAVRPGGFVLVATFAEDGPVRCSGLDVARYSPAALQGEFGPEFTTVESRRDEHHTPKGVVQAFTYCLCRYDTRERRRAGEAAGRPSA
jgi:ubiquinone/menaquinone biosynthesis C-methylase UbiE